MRLIGTLNDEQKGLAFSSFLNQKGISHQLELHPNTDWGSHEYGTSQCRIWIRDEDQVEEALKWYELFLENPQDPAFQHTISQPLAPFFIPAAASQTANFEKAPPASPPIPQTAGTETRWEKQSMGWITRGFLILCCLLFLATQLIKPSFRMPSDMPALTLFASPVEKTLMYDYPHFYELIDRFIQLYGFEGLENPQEVPKEGRLLLNKIKETPFWQGFYNIALTKGFSSLLPEFLQAPLFEKIHQGQIWRVFTPVLLHGDIFHLLFNMLWLIVLGKQIEQRLRPFSYLCFILILGIFSNTAQYLMGGANFIGFSGILCGMLTFIWMRQRYAPWEGYQLDRLTILFMLIFIVGMAFIQLLSFFLEKSLQLAIAPNIANMAHLTGAAIGIVFGRLNVFSWRHS
ncbi:rhomboid family intramembrane serine protease [Candidatus Protochlamydia phocaeensis]|uniref:rhomboid family intramembrane serine protease n=1 Tax=Candidatus Protochlamydia phocaeensis TaxID=1414722 RepID=UPI0008396564|nr:rhomboid family intramembrane serine protease [Candidatus Protochlamydia phocaeensis]